MMISIDNLGSNQTAPSLGVHGEKLKAARNNDKLPHSDIPRLDDALVKYEQWIKELNEVDEDSLEAIIEKMVSLLNNYKYYIELKLIYDSSEDFLYRQKGQLKIDNTILEEFLPIFINKCLTFDDLGKNTEISSQSKIFSSLYFDTDLQRPDAHSRTGLSIKVKDQDFSISKTLYLQASYDKNFQDSSITETKIGFVLAEIKTNLDKTMFQEASATARDVKMAVTGAKYYLLCEFLDMTPISSQTTNIDEVMVLRKGKRMNSNVRKNFATSSGRQVNREIYKRYLEQYPFDTDLFKRFYTIVKESFTEIDLTESDALSLGYF